jgi:CheY-like chemotaxis protein
MTGMHTILCSDNRTVVDAASRAFDSESDRLTVCESGMELLGAVKALSSDLVILDLGMHGLGGLLLASAIRELAPGLPIVAVSVKSDVDARPLVQRGVPYAFLGAVAGKEARTVLADLVSIARAGPAPSERGRRLDHPESADTSLALHRA